MQFFMYEVNSPTTCNYLPPTPIIYTTDNSFRLSISLKQIIRFPIQIGKGMNQNHYRYVVKTSGYALGLFVVFKLDHKHFV